MINRLIFVTGLVLLCFSITSGIFLLPLVQSSHPAFQMIPLPYPGGCVGGCSGGTGVPTISESDPSSLAIVGELPKQMDSSTSAIIEVKFTFLTPLRPQLQFPSSNNERAILYPDISHSLDDDVTNYCSLHSTSKVCSGYPPAVAVGDLFGPGYELFASAHLVATGFDVQLLDATEQSTDQFIIEWDWNIFPKSAGNQPVNLDVDLHWKSVGNNGKEDVFRQIWEANPTITVNPPLFITPGQLTISRAVEAFFGLIFAGVSGPMILGKLKKRYEGKRRERVEQELEQEQAKRILLEQELEQEQAKRILLEQELERERAKRKPLEQVLERERAAREQAERRLRRERARRGGSR